MPEDIGKYPPGFPWVQQFRLRSWWLSPAKGRIFVITHVFYEDDGQVRLIEMLECKKEVPKYVTREQMIEWLNNDQIQPVSSQPINI